MSTIVSVFRNLTHIINIYNNIMNQSLTIELYIFISIRLGRRDNLSSHFEDTIGMK